MTATVTEALRAIVDFCDDPNGSEQPESLGMGLARLLPAARAALSTAPSGDGVTEAAIALVNFAWSAVVTDCTESAEYLNELVDNLRTALETTSAGDGDGLSEWAGWDQARFPWGETKHKDAVLEALFRGPWSVEDCAILIDFIDRTWTCRPAAYSGDGVPGMVLVPREPTPEMLGAWYRYKSGHHWPDEPPPRDTSDVGAYRAMLAAALSTASSTGKETP